MEKKEKIRIVITGCIHGNLEKIYSDILKNNKEKIDLIICTGDFESLITKNDLNYLSCPEKYKTMGDFYKYYNKIKKVPILTIFIGGNHEASNILNENFYGGYICENIFYLGRSNYINYKGINILGISGIYNYFDYFKGHFEKDILKNIKSIFHVREFDIAKLSYINDNNIDIFISHDWPNNIINKNDINNIIKNKPLWKNDILNNKLGSFPNQFLLNLLKPKYYCCGHMHYYYKNTIFHNNNSITNFIALDKCLNNRKFYEVIEFDINDNYNDNNIYINKEWISITKVFNDIFPVENLNYDYSNFIRRNDEYLEMIKKYYSNFKNLNQINYNFLKQEFDEELEKEKKKNLNNIKVEFNNNQYETMIKIFNIIDSHNYHKIIKKNERNSEEIDLTNII